MAVTLQEILLPQVVMDLISRIKRGRGPLGSWLGFHSDRFSRDTVSLEGPNTLRGNDALRTYTYRIFDNTRVAMKMVSPGRGPATVARQPVGTNTVSIGRFHEKVPILYEELGQLSPMVGPNSQIDPKGQDYVARQVSNMAQKGNMTVEGVAAGMMRDSLYFLISGDNFEISFTAPDNSSTFGLQVPFNVPAGNKNQLNMLGTGNLITVPWSNPNALIISDVNKIVAAYAQLSGFPMTHVWINTLLWTAIITNTEVRNTAGSSNQPFAEWDQDITTGTNEQGPPSFTGKLRGLPNVTWHFDDGVLATGTDIDPDYSTAPATATLNKFVPDGMAIFSTDPGGDWAKLYLGGEYVVENYGMPGQLRSGWYMWNEYVTQPSTIELISLLNIVPALYVPKVVAPATVDGFAT